MGEDGYGGCSKDRKAGINHRDKRSDHTPVTKLLLGIC